MDDDIAWDDLDRRINEAYWDMDEAALKAAIAACEHYALEVFRTCRAKR